MIALASTTARAIEPRDRTYYCTPEAVGGVRYDEQLKKWRSANFRPSGNFVLKLQYVSSRKDRMFSGADESTVHEFKVTVTEAGSSKELPCTNMRDYKLPISVWPDGWVLCSASLSEYKFSPANNRYLAAYLVGFVDGTDNNEDTPSIAVGVCTKIN
ncbi:hypothetical protein IVB34_14755 [Bradyrhizobium sp. 2]|uniref:hypothetical protein n=1 Tax=Bradyrhizobium sp. 2 TaxID=190045 RepID=UPI001FFC0AA8|nr:hypothetical protein [Bradyrhizobium sp. 2]MCK1459614.1 hypothetical protein [Bradyrhizobium sp. 2]